MRPKNFHLVSVNATKANLEEDWLQTNPELLERIVLSQRPSQILLGDFLVYYTSSGQRIIGIVRSSVKGSDIRGERSNNRSGEIFTIKVSRKHASNTLSESPSYKVLGLGPDDITGLGTKLLNDQQARMAWEAFTDEPFPGEVPE